MNILNLFFLQGETKYVKEINLSDGTQNKLETSMEKKSLDPKDKSLKIYNVKDREEKQTKTFKQSQAILHVMCIPKRKKQWQQ